MKSSHTEAISYKQMNIEMFRIMHIMKAYLKSIDIRISEFYLEEELNSYSRQKMIFQTCHFICLLVLTTVKDFTKMNSFCLKELNNQNAKYDVIVDEVKEIKVIIDISLTATIINKDENVYKCSLNPVFTVLHSKIRKLLKEFITILSLQNVWTLNKNTKVFIMTDNVQRIKIVSIALNKIKSNLSWEVSPIDREEPTTPVEQQLLNQMKKVEIHNRTEIQIFEASALGFSSLMASGNVMSNLPLSGIMEICKAKNNYKCFLKRSWAIRSLFKTMFITRIVECTIFPSHGPIENWIKTDDKRILNELSEEEIFRFWELDEMVIFIEKIIFENSVSDFSTSDEYKYGDIYKPA